MMKKDKIKMCVIIIIAMAFITWVWAEWSPLNDNVEVKEPINYNKGIELIQANEVYEVIVYQSSAEIWWDGNSLWNYTFEFPDRQIFLEFVQEEIENGNKLVLRKGESSLIQWLNWLWKVVFLVGYVWGMYTLGKLLLEVVFYKKIEIPEEEKKIRAYHEAGHVLAFEILKIQCDITEVSILSDDNGNVGYICYNADENRDYTKKTEFKDQLVVLLAGRAAEKEALAENSSMCFDDLIKATNIAKEMVTIYGMDDEIGPMSFWNEASKEVNLYYSDICDNAEIQIQKLLKEADTKAAEIVKTKKHVLDKIAQALLEEKTISGEELEEIMKEKM